MSEKRNPNIWKNSGYLDDKFVNDVKMKWKRLYNIHKQNGSYFIGIIDGKMLVCVVKEKKIAFPPPTYFAPHIYVTKVWVCNIQPQVQSQDTGIGSAVGV